MKLSKLILSLIVAISVVVAGTVALYLKGLPYLVSNKKVVAYLQKSVKQQVDADLIVENPLLHTSLSSDIEFKVDKISLTKGDAKLLSVENFNTKLSFAKIFSKNIIIKKLVAKSIFADVNNLQSLLPKSDEKKSKSDWKVDVYDALLGVRDCEILYNIDNDTTIHLKGEHIGVNNALKDKRNVYFQLFADIFRNNKTVHLAIKDNKKVFFENNHFYVKECPISINKSNIFINLKADKKQNFEISVFSKNLNLTDIIDFLNTQIIENNVNESLAYFSDIQGNLDFILGINKGVLDGDFNVKRVSFKVNDVDKLPITITKGKIKLDSKEVKLSGFEGYYDNNLKNKIDFEGTVKDYLNTIDTDIVGNAVVRNDFFKTHLSKITGTPFEIKGEAPTRIMFKSKRNIMDFVWLFMLKPGQNIKVANDYLPFEDSLRLMRSDMHLENMVLDIKSLDYHMIPADKLPDKNAPRKKRPQGQRPQPVFRLKSSIDIAHNSDIKFVSFEIPKPLPSELLNAVLRQEIFKKGQISGAMTLDNRGKFPILNGNMNMDKVILPSQMLFIRNADLKTSGGMVSLTANGGYRWSKFNFSGDVLNEIKFPLIVKDVKLSLENIDAYKLLEESANSDFKEKDSIKTDDGIVNVKAPQQEFDIRNIIVEKGNFHLDKGSYKDIEFANLDADFSLNKDGVVDIKSNRFDFAKGMSSLKANFDLINKKYNVKLGIKDVDSDVIANALLDLKREIVGKASGFLDISTDETAKISGTIKFIVKNGAIEKIGLVEYVLKCASLLRNTVTMISPAIFADIVNVPEGNFDKITGDLTIKRNVVTGIKIKTYSAALSNYIAGRYNIDNGDTSLRIYTQFSDAKKGITGLLRKISLNSLANRIPINSRNDANYYSVELSELPPIEANEKDCQIFLTRVEGDVVNNNYISSLKKIK